MKCSKMYMVIYYDKTRKLSPEPLSSFQASCDIKCVVDIRQEGKDI